MSSFASKQGYGQTFVRGGFRRAALNQGKKERVAHHGGLWQSISPPEGKALHFMGAFGKAHQSLKGVTDSHEPSKTAFTDGIRAKMGKSTNDPSE